MVSHFWNQDTQLVQFQSGTQNFVFYLRCIVFLIIIIIPQNFNILWLQRLAPYFTANTSVVEDLGCSAPIPRATPSLGPYITRGEEFVDRTLRACFVTCSPRHDLSPLSLLYKHCSFSSPTGPVLHSFLCVLGRFRLRAWVLKTTKECL